MKKQFITRVFLSSLVLALTSLFGGGNLLAQESSVTFDFSDYSSGKNVKDVTLSIDGITISSTSNASTDDRFWTYNSTIELRTYAKNVLSVKAEIGKSIKSVTFVTTTSSFTLSKYFTITPKGTIKGATWTVAEDASSTNEVSFTCTSSMTKQSVTGITVTYTSTGDPSKTNPELKYSEATCDVIIGESYTLPKLSNPYSVAIIYSSSEESVATVDEAGNVNLKGEGTTTIKAYFPGNETYAKGSASYTLTVKKPNVFVYKKVTSAEDLIKGAKYVFVCEETNKVGSDVSGNKMQPTTATLTNGILEKSVGEPMEFVLDIKDGKYYFISGKQYLKGANKGTEMTMIDYKTTDDGIKWNILFKEENVLIYNDYDPAGGTGRRLMYRSSKDYNVFGHYNETIGTEYYNVQLYQKVYPLTVSSATGGYATFYNEEEAYKMPEGLTGYAVTEAENGHYITRKTAYEAGATVPAKTPLLIIGAVADYYPAVVSGTGVEAYAGSNLLEGTRDANGKTLSDNDGDVYYYKLGLNTKGVPGFYWGAVGGAAFKMTKATTAYLAVPKKLVEGANALFFDFGPETGINEIQTEQADKAIFDLSGRRVQKATKGFYIVGGKKVLVK